MICISTYANHLALHAVFLKDFQLKHCTLLNFNVFEIFKGVLTKLDGKLNLLKRQEGCDVRVFVVGISVLILNLDDI